MFRPVSKKEGTSEESERGRGESGYFRENDDQKSLLSRGTAMEWEGEGGVGSLFQQGR